MPVLFSSVDQCRAQMTNHATVSVVIPTYNMGWSIVRAIRSCQKQTYSAHEIVVVDDGSTDETRQIVAAEASKDSRIHYVAPPFNVGCAAAMRMGISKATGEWIAFLDADDELTPNSIADRISVLKKRKGEQPGLIYGHVYVNRVSDKSLVKFRALDGHCYPYLCKELSLCAQIVMMVRRDCFFTSGFPSAEFPSSTDDDMVLTVAKHFPVACVDKPVAIIHGHDSPTRMTNNPLRVARGVAMLVSKYRKDVVRHHGRRYLVLWWLRIARAYLSAEIQRLTEKRKNAIHLPSNLRVRSLVRVRLRILGKLFRVLDRFLRRHFDYIYFGLLLFI